MRVTFSNGDLTMQAETDVDRRVLQRIFDNTDVAGCGFLLDPYRIDHVSLDIKGKEVDVQVPMAEKPELKWASEYEGVAGLQEKVDKAAKCAVDGLVELCHGASTIAGWWTDPKTGEHLINAPRIVQEKLLLVHSELSEAMEGYRKNLMDDKLPHRKMIEVELADACIRIFDLAGAMGLDLGGALVEKMQFNRVRPDHKLENRIAEGGKRF